MAAAMTYSMAVGDRDAARLALLDQHYNPSSRAFLESVGLCAGATVADIGCGHGAMTAWLAERVGPDGVVYAVDASAEQLEIARRMVGDLPQVRYVHARIEDAPLEPGSVDWVYSRFLLMHVADAAAALTAMERMLADDGALLLEMSDVGALRFVPADDPAADLWREWWFALGRARGAAHDIYERTPQLLTEAGFIIARRDRFQPVSAMPEAKMLHALGFEQCVPAYLEHAGADPAAIDAHRAFLQRVVPDTDIAVELYATSQYFARKRPRARRL
ncbi:class I SAM-dependent methyltransferase [Nocardia nova]|jgi:ubiquinone/menaquinone biosynthesis C-methylase UbiE|uniref:class I SAM-dependent methyltransferase n=1 Tax=Nocardia nova TaxID=37330 RepID=UPI001C4838DA|nr:class I SAM-dependent methyltransferase [Nocardia nova]MBV7706685.1 class I SAM-dependent methyltransferase [Nocardia nova]